MNLTNMDIEAYDSINDKWRQVEKVEVSTTVGVPCEVWKNKNVDKHWDTFHIRFRDANISYEINDGSLRIVQ